jgi:TPR repeat protein
VGQAVKWFIKAARQGDKTAQHNLGVYYASIEAAEDASVAEGATEGSEGQPQEENEAQPAKAEE